MSRARQKIREAAERHGFTVAALEWTPIGQMIEMQGREGGWYVEVQTGPNHSGIATGYSWQDVVEQIDRCAPMWLDGSLIG
jgi:hypothetical protein